MELICQIQHYDWGSRDPGCNVYTLSVQNDANKSVQVSDGKLQKPHAEYWVGTHVNGPSVIKQTGQLLSEYVKQNPDALGAKLVEKFGTELPFLLKILSVGKPLSIQAHPNKKHAEELHSKFPDIYKDPNHKPEMLVTLTPFQMLRGFRPISDIQTNLKCVPELRQVIGSDVVNALSSCSQAEGKEALQRAYKALMMSPQQLVEHALNTILARLKHADEATRVACHADLLESLQSHFPGDVGVLSLYFLQDFTMQPGEVAFLPANQIHAYILGECVEIMACSDNVVRGGLTPKLKDVDTLCAMLEYDPADMAPNLDKIEFTDNCTKYVPHGIADFAIMHVRVGSGHPDKISIPSNNCASVVLALGPAVYSIDDGPSSELRRGTTLFIRADQALSLCPSPWQQDDTSDVFIALCNV